MPVVGNGDVLFPQDIAASIARSGCAGVMVARAALIKPWIFREATTGYWDITTAERVALYRRYVTLANAHWGEDDYGRLRVRMFVRWHVDFWRRYLPQRRDGTFPSMQQRDAWIDERSAVDALLARDDEAGMDYVTDCLVTGADLDPERAPQPTSSVPERELTEVEG